MSLFRRLAGFACLLALLAGAAAWFARESMRSRESNQARGLRWLKEEYELDHATFLKVAALHEAYFASCDKMCREIKAASRPLLMRARHPSGGVAGVWQQEQQLCDECQEAAKKHLHQVARLMPPERGRRFLDDMLPALERQRQRHDRETSALARR